MFGKRKKKNHTEEMSYDAYRYGQARSEWLSNKPQPEKLDLPDCIYSPTGEDAVYFHWNLPSGMIGLNIFGKENRFQTYIKDYHIDFLYYALLSLSEGTVQGPQGVVLEGESFYLNVFIDKGLKIERYEDEYFTFTWINYRKDPEESYTFLYKQQQLDIWIDSLKAFLEESYRYQHAFRDWASREPQTWQFPLTREEEGLA